MVMQDLVSRANANYYLVVATLFSFIFAANASGMILYSTTITAQLGFTLGLSGAILLVLWLHSVLRLKIKAANHFVPEGSPLQILMFIISVEITSVSSRLLSMAVRLFANITSGHALLKILAGFAIVATLQPAVWSTSSIIPWFIILIITSLESLIAFLQSYVFANLSLIYVSEQG